MPEHSLHIAPVPRPPRRSRRAGGSLATPAVGIPRKKSWPLFLLAGLAFIPMLGVVFGLIATCWGLLTDRPRAILAAGVGAAGVLLNFAACFGLGYWTIAHDGRPGGIRSQLAQTDLQALVVSLEDFHQRTGHYPERLVDLRVPFSVRPLPIWDKTVGLFNQTRPYQYFLARDGASYQLFAVGPDGLPGTADDLLPRLSDSLTTHSGYRPRALSASSR